MGFLAIIGVIWFLWDVISEALEPQIPAENWRNWDLIRQDSHLSSKEFIRNLRNGKYR